MDKKLKLLANELGEARVKFDESLHYYTGRNLDLIAEAFYIATTQQELLTALNAALELEVPVFVLGYDNLDPKKKQTEIKGLVIKNRSHSIKISGIKGKFVVGSMGIDQVLLEVDSGVSLSEMKTYFLNGKLMPPIVTSNEALTFGEVLAFEFGIQGLVETIKVWEKGVIEEVNILQFHPKKQIVLSAVLKARSSQYL